MPLTFTNNTLRGSEADFATLANVVFDHKGETELWRRVARVKADASAASRNANFRGGKRRLSNRRNLALHVPAALTWEVYLYAAVVNARQI